MLHDEIAVFLAPDQRRLEGYLMILEANVRKDVCEIE